MDANETQSKKSKARLEHSSGFGHSSARQWRQCCLLSATGLGLAAMVILHPLSLLAAGERLRASGLDSSSSSLALPETTSSEVSLEAPAASISDMALLKVFRNQYSGMTIGKISARPRPGAEGPGRKSADYADTFI
ncbi:MAG: hypothetical protein FRX49_05427 [Trebouxia sp. A1-2]|nr:MAG: hypothetical protein FRX49_05427 [Trebouxia sp. A1-2]